MIQIQHLLKLNNVDAETITKIPDSNTTLVKVKLLVNTSLYLGKSYSNTTLVKVKSLFSTPGLSSNFNSNTTLVKVKWKRKNLYIPKLN